MTDRLATQGKAGSGMLHAWSATMTASRTRGFGHSENVRLATMEEGGEAPIQVGQNLGNTKSRFV